MNVGGSTSRSVGRSHCEFLPHLITLRYKDFSLGHLVKTGSGTHPVTCSVGTAGYCCQAVKLSAHSHPLVPCGTSHDGDCIVDCNALQFRRNIPPTFSGSKIRPRNWSCSLICWFLSWFTLPPWRWKRYFLKKAKPSPNYTVLQSRRSYHSSAWVKKARHHDMMLN
jgi:hypothetical protein